MNNGKKLARVKLQKWKYLISQQCICHLNMIKEKYSSEKRPHCLDAAQVNEEQVKTVMRSLAAAVAMGLPKK
jgi:hypothetical protein